MMNKVTEEIKNRLQEKMNNIIRIFEENGTYPYELYTLMCTMANEFNIYYSLDLHGELMENL